MFHLLFCCFKTFETCLGIEYVFDESYSLLLLLLSKLSVFLISIWVYKMTNFGPFSSVKTSFIVTDVFILVLKLDDYYLERIHLRSTVSNIDSVPVSVN